MPAFDHLSDAVNDLAFSQGLLRKGSGNTPRYARRRLAATIWVPGLPVSLLLGAWAQSWLVALIAIVVLVTGLVVFAEKGDVIGAWLRRQTT